MGGSVPLLRLRGTRVPRPPSRGRRGVAGHRVVQVRAVGGVRVAVGLSDPTDRRVFDAGRLGFARDPTAGGRDRGTLAPEDVFGRPIAVVERWDGDYYISW